jgi:hypothetical protein
MDPGDQPRPLPLPHLSREDRTWLSRKYHRRVKTATRAVLGVTLVSCLLFDWDTYLGTDKHIFHNVRPAFRRMMDGLYGLNDSADQTKERRA